MTYRVTNLVFLWADSRRLVCLAIFKIRINKVNERSFTLGNLQQKNSINLTHLKAEAPE